MKSMLALRRALTAAGLILIALVAVPSARATHLRGGSLSWKVTSTTATTYTVQFTLTESQRWSYPNSVAGSCSGPISGSTTACVPAGTAVQLGAYTGLGTFYYGDGTSVGNQGNSGDVGGTVTSINQAQDYATAIFVFSHTYNISAGQLSPYFYATNRIDGLKVGGSEPEYISTIVQNYSNPAPVASVPAILSVPLLPTATFNLSTAVSDIDPNVNLVYRLSTFAEIFGPSTLSGLTSVPCPITSVPYTQGGVASGNPPGFSISSAGVVTWNESQIQPAITGGNCGFGVPAAGDLWTAQVMVEVHNKTTNAIITKVPIDLLMQLVSPVGALPTVTINPSATQNVNINTPVSFTATGSSSNAGAKVTLNASGVPSGATVTGLNATVTPPATSNFSWTPSALQAGTYVITYTVTDSNLQQAQASKTLVVATLPTVSCSAGTSVLAGSSSGLTATVYDPSNELLNVVWTVDSNTVQTDTGLTAYPTPFVDSLTQTISAAGVHAVTATATDPHGVSVSCSTSVTVYQPTSLVLAPANPIAGTPVTLNATLTTTPGGTPVVGQTVVFTSSNASPSTSTSVTNSAGVATASVTFSNAATDSVTATFSNVGSYFTDAAGDIPPAPTTASELLNVAPATSSLSAVNVASTALVGNALTVSTTLTRVSAPSFPVSGETVVFRITAPDGSMSTQSATTDASGLASVSFTPQTRGVYSIAAQFAGDTSLQAATSTSASVTVYQGTSLALAPASGTAGSNLTVRATLTTYPGGTPLAGQTVTFDFAGVINSTSATTDANGVAAVTVQFPNAGTFSDTASFSNPGGYFTNASGATSPPSPTVSSSSVTVVLASTNLSTPASVPASALVGVPFSASSTLTRISAPYGPVASVPVAFVFTAPDNSVTTLTATTLSSGLATVSFTPAQAGVYTIAVQFAGNNALQNAVSNASVPVTPAPQAIAFTPPPSPVVAGTSVVLSATGGASGNPVVFSVQSGPASLAADGVTLTYTGTGSVVLTADQAGSSNYTAAPELTATINTVAPAYIVTVNTDAASGNGVATNCVDPNLPSYATAANANCSLRDAITAADALSVVTTNIGFSLPNPSTILIASGTAIQITQNVNLNGPGASAVIIEGGIAPYNGTTQTANNSILLISNGTVSITGVTLANGFISGNGGAISANGSGNLTVSNTTFSGNRAGTNGAAVYCNLSAALTVTNSIFVSNQFANNGGAIFAEAGCPLTVTGSTFSGNRSGGSGGAIYALSQATVANSTFSGNSAVNGYGGGIYDQSPLTIANSTFSGNETGNSGGGIYANANVVVTNSVFSNDPAQHGSAVFANSGGTVSNVVYQYDLFSGVTPTNSILGNPNLGPLLNYGGPTPTLIPLPGSAAICAGTVPTLNGSPLATDQRGITISGARYGQTACYDVGAVQTQYGFSATFNVPSLVTLGSPVSPAPVATVTESGTPVTQFVTTVNMTDADNDLSGAATVSLGTVYSTGQATFSNLLFTGPEVSDTLTATLPLNTNVSPVISLSATSNSFQVGQLMPTITWATPAPITYGAALSSAQLNATATYNSVSVPGNYVYAPLAGTVLAPGSQTLSVTFNPTSATYASVSQSVTLQVNKSTPSITLFAPGSIVYGTPLLSLSAALSWPGPATPTGAFTFLIDSGTAGIVVPATCTSAGNCTATFNSATLSAGTHTIAASIAADNNYNSASAAPTTFSVSRAPLTVTAGSYSGVYDGSTHALSGCVVSSNPDGLTCTNNPVGPVGPDVGGAAVLPVVSGSTTNYTVTTNNGAWSITPLAVTLTAGSSTSVYDGSAHAPSACTSSNAGVTCTNSPASVGPGVSSGGVTPIASYVVGLPSDYTLTAQAGTYSITPATSQTIVSCPSNVVYTGAAQTPCTAVVTGVGGLSQSVTVTYTPNANVGLVTASATFSGDANHTGSGGGASFHITPAPLTLTAGSYTGVYDGSAHALSGCVTSSNPDGLTCVNNPAGPVGPDVGGTTVTPVLIGSASNYTVSSNNGSWSITAKPVTITAGSYSGVYDGSAHAPSACTSTYAGVSCTNSPASVGPGVGSGPVTAVPSFSGSIAADYAITAVQGSYSITKLAASVTPNAAGKVYGTTDPVLSGTLSGFLPVDGVTATYARTSGESVAGSPYTISATLSPTASLSNYAVTYNTAAFTITKATPVVNWTSPSPIVYGTGLSAAQLNATANPAGGMFSYTPAAGTVLSAGSQTLSVLYTPADTADYTTASASVALTVTQATPVVTWANPPSIIYGTGTGTAQKTATATGVGGVSLPGSYFYTTPDGTIFTVGQHPLGVAFTPTDITDYVPVSAYATITVTKATPSVTWAAPAAITYGTALSGTQLNATASVPGSFSYSPAAGTVLHAGAQTLTVTFTPTDTTDYSPVTTTVPLTVNKATPVITWPTPASITYGTPLSATQLNATANVAGTFLYTASTGPNPLGVLLPPGTTALSATLTPTDSVDYNPVTAYVVFTVSKAQSTTTLAITTTQTVTGTTATITATVHPQIGGTPTGTVTYYTGSTLLGSAAVGTPFTTGVLPVGTNQITAVYGGDSNFVGSSSSATTVVSLAPTTVTLTPALTRVFYPASAVSFTVIVPLKNLQLISGTITLYDGSTVIGSYSLPAGGVLAGVTPQLSVGTHNLRAVYSGDSRYPPGQSPIETVTVSAL
jgi:predicted outer membrane repeat protein